jgi:hypothetical protein
METPNEVQTVAPSVTGSARRLVSIWQGLRGFGLKKLFLACAGVGAGLAVGVTATTASLIWFTSRPIPIHEWPRLEVEGVGLRAKLKTDWSDSVRYQFVVTPRSDELKGAFDRAVRTHRDSISFTIHLYDKAGFELCKKDVKPTPFVDAEDRFDRLHANETFYSSECPRAQYKEADHWSLSYVFPALAADTSQNAATPNGRAVEGKRVASTKPSIGPETPNEGDDTLTGFDFSSGHLETRSGKTFVIYRDGERYTALVWSTSSPIHFNCKSRSDCLVENIGNSEAVHGRLLK